MARKETDRKDAVLIVKLRNRVDGVGSSVQVGLEECQC